MKSVLLVAILGQFIGCDGCGDNNHNNPPTPDAPNPTIDSQMGSDAGAFVECNYTEQQDATNDFDTMPPGIEETGLHFAPGDTRTICGNVDNTHFDMADGIVDVDNYHVTIDQDSDVLFTLTAPPGVSPSALAAISAIQISAFSDQAAAVVSPGGFFNSLDHAVISAHLAAGTYQFAMEATDNTNAPASVPYELRLTTDVPTTRCAQLTGTPNYTEANDGASSQQNDVISVDSNGVVALLGAGRNTPEPTGLALAPGSDYLIDGTSAAVMTPTAGYFDMDTYAVVTGPTTTQISVRLDWVDTSALLDYYVFDANVVNDNAEIITQSNTSLEKFGTAATIPSATYYISVGEAIKSQNVGILAPYTLTVCTSTFVQGP
jgi:hypothetical protein